ncbi:MAG: HlyC/CorC family transporter [Parachlamydiales bacterium]|nr:HlyC/CorC family transporter [Parachlamydiales bacterium]
MSLSFLLLAIILLIGTFFLTACSSSLRQLRKLRSRSQIDVIGKSFFYRGFHQVFFGKKEHHTLYFSVLCAKNITLFAFAVISLGFVLDITDQLAVFFPSATPHTNLYWGLSVVGALVCLALSLLIGDLLPRTWAFRHPISAFRTSSGVASVFLILYFPLSFLILKLFSHLGHVDIEGHAPTGKVAMAEKVQEILQEAELSGQLAPNDRALIHAVLSFKDRIVREIMVPRIDIFSLPHTTTLRQATELLVQEGYSRVPVFRETIDNVLGVLMYKDILKIYMDEGKSGGARLEQTIETLLKPVFYTPETKKVSQLLQEFRHKQSHMAIVVDEYGGTEGIVTIEDILEEIVGEIADEYDDEEAKLYFAQPGGGWVVDARMSILDAEETFQIKLPHDGEYDTIAGYIFHRAGTIPPKGFRIHHDTFDLEVISSNDRSVKKVRIHPRISST